MKAGLLVLLWITAALAQADSGVSVVHGQRLFQGDAPLAARIFGQDFVLPSDASRCLNCHYPAMAAPSSASADTQRFGPLLTASLLTDALRRRGGPPSRYDATSLCKLLRTGIDPAHVIIQRTMPRYEMTDANCQSLWLYLTRDEARR